MSENRRVVITGIGAITPVGNTVDECWENLKAGKNGIGNITQFDTTDFKAKLAGEVKDFDPLMYMTRSESLRADRNTQFAIGASAQAVEDSGILGNIDPDRFGVCIGSGIGGIKTFEIEHSKLIEKGPSKVSPFFVPMMIANMASGTVAIKYDCRNSVMPAVTACATGSNAIGEAMRLIRHGYADAIIAGGTEAPICKSAVAGFINICALSTETDPNKASLPFDKRRAGFVMGEGAVVFILEEYEHAKSRGAKIYGEICGYGSTCDAHHITAPHPEARGGAKAMIDAMKEANYISSDRVYVNAHGTGTPMNDKIETMAIKKAFGEEKAKEVFVSSTKSMTGHMLGSAGAIEALACIMALRDDVIPPTINLLEFDENCDLNYVPNKAINQKIDLALSNSLGFGGHNACLAFRRI